MRTLRGAGALCSAAAGVAVLQARLENTQQRTGFSFVYSTSSSPYCYAGCQLSRGKL
jgi:hypothetical protein